VFFFCLLALLENNEIRNNNLRLFVLLFTFNLAQLSGQEWGDSSGEAWVALHGWLDNCGTFENLAEIFAKNQKRFLAIDLPGHGFSSHYTPG
jgi:pimeloyl-ACP methyl ester carboxylesterase